MGATLNPGETEATIPATETVVDTETAATTLETMAVDMETAATTLETMTVDTETVATTLETITMDTEMADQGLATETVGPHRDPTTTESNQIFWKKFKSVLHSDLFYM